MLSRELQQEKQSDLAISFFPLRHSNASFRATRWLTAIVKYKNKAIRCEDSKTNSRLCRLPWMMIRHKLGLGIVVRMNRQVASFLTSDAFRCWPMTVLTSSPSDQ